MASVLIRQAQRPENRVPVGCEKAEWQRSGDDGRSHQRGPAIAAPPGQPNQEHDRNGGDRNWAEEKIADHGEAAEKSNRRRPARPQPVGRRMTQQIGRGQTRRDAGRVGHGQRRVGEPDRAEERQRDGNERAPGHRSRPHQEQPEDGERDRRRNRSADHPQQVDGHLQIPSEVEEPGNRQHRGVDRHAQQADAKRFVAVEVTAESRLVARREDLVGALVAVDRKRPLFHHREHQGHSRVDVPARVGVVHRRHHHHGRREQPKGPTPVVDRFKCSRNGVLHTAFCLLPSAFCLRFRRMVLSPRLLTSEAGPFSRLLPFGVLIFALTLTTTL